MNSAKRTIEIPKRQAPLALPLKLGYADGSSAHIVTDAKGVAIGSPFGIPHGMTVEEARKSEATAQQVKVAEYMLNAINSYEILVGALTMIHAVPPNKRTADFAKQALVASGEMKE
jgi:hypothetical protein